MYKTAKIVMLAGVVVFFVALGLGALLPVAQQQEKMIYVSVAFASLAVAILGLVFGVMLESRRVGWKNEPAIAAMLLAVFSVVLICWAVSPESAQHFLGYSRF